MKTLVIGVGNRLFRDEGVGCHLADALSERDPIGVQVLDWGTCPDPPPGLADAEAVVVIDACNAGGEPGSVHWLSADDIMAPPWPVSFHETSLIDSLPLLATLYGIRHVAIMGIQCGELGWSLDLSPALEERLPHLVAVVLQKLQKMHEAVEGDHAYTTAETA